MNIIKFCETNIYFHEKGQRFPITKEEQKTAAARLFSPKWSLGAPAHIKMPVYRLSFFIYTLLSLGRPIILIIDCLLIVLEHIDLPPSPWGPGPSARGPGGKGRYIHIYVHTLYI